MNLNTFLSKVDCTLLEANATVEDYRNMTREACEWKCRAVCVPSGFLHICKMGIATWQGVHAMHPHSIKTCVVVDFPDGSLDTESRVSIVKGLRVIASECDVVMPIGFFLSGAYSDVEEDLVEINSIGYNILGENVLKVKVIVETGYLSDEKILKSAEIVQRSGAFCWKTSTGRDPKVAIPEKARHVRLVREAFPYLKIKAAGGIRTQDDVLMLHEAGADIFGISWQALQAIIQDWK